jgi:hypothetical protein
MVSTIADIYVLAYFDEIWLQGFKSMLLNFCLRMGSNKLKKE